MINQNDSSDKLILQLIYRIFGNLGAYSSRGIFAIEHAFLDKSIKIEIPDENIISESSIFAAEINDDIGLKILAVRFFFDDASEFFAVLLSDNTKLIGFHLAYDSEDKEPIHGKIIEFTDVNKFEQINVLHALNIAAGFEMISYYGKLWNYFENEKDFNNLYLSLKYLVEST